MSAERQQGIRIAQSPVERTQLFDAVTVEIIGTYFALRSIDWYKLAGMAFFKVFLSEFITIL